MTHFTSVLYNQVSLKKWMLEVSSTLGQKPYISSYGCACFLIRWRKKERKEWEGRWKVSITAMTVHLKLNMWNIKAVSANHSNHCDQNRFLEELSVVGLYQYPFFLPSTSGRNDLNEWSEVNTMTTVLWLQQSEYCQHALALLTV